MELRDPFRLLGDGLMTDHFHLPLRPEPGVAIGRVGPSIPAAHARRYRRRHRAIGHARQGRFIGRMSLGKRRS
jgi:hypothetical protein